MRVTTNNKHLVRAGHEFAAAMTSDTPIITIAKMMTELAMALDVQSARSEALAAKLNDVCAENEELKRANSVALNILNDEDTMITSLWASSVHKVVAETPSTDAWVNEQRTIGRVEGVNFAAARLAAAFNHGFIDKPTAEVYDVVKAVLGAKEELATAPDDGLSGEYAEQALNDWAEQLRGGQV